MKNKLYIILIISISMLSIVFAQDPPDLPGPPNQGPIGGLGWMVISGLILEAKKYFGSHKK